jgi:ribosomal protein S13
MLVQARKCLKNKPIVKKLPRKDKNAALNFLMYSIYGINYNTAKLIVDTHDLHSLNDIFTLTYDNLIEIKGIGKNTAKKIIGAIHGSQD